MKRITLGLMVLVAGMSAFGVPYNNYLDETGFPRLIPGVQKLEKQTGVYSMPKVVKISAPEGLDYECKVLADRIHGRFGSWNAVQAKAGEQAQCRIRLDGQDLPEQGYRIKVSKAGFDIQAKTNQGVFYAVQTLGNLITNNITVDVPCCTIEDWPDLAMRGFYLDMRRLKNEDVDTFCKVLDAMGHFKLNAFEADFGGTLPFANSPFTAQPGYTQDSLDKILAACRRNYIDIIPHLQTLTHDQWLRAHPKYLTDITSRKTVYDKTVHNSTWNTTMCPNQPLGRELTDYAIRETIRILKPRFFHLSMDEFHLCQWDKCEHCPKGHTPEDMIREIRHYLELVKSLGVQPEMYQDAFTPERCDNDKLALPLRAALPRDVTVSFWDYAIRPRQDLYEALQKDGFKDIVGVSFCYRLPNTMSLPLMIKEQGGRGIILTYWGWSGQMVKPLQFGNNAASATAITAAFGWRPEKVESLMELGWDPAQEFARFLPFGIREQRPGRRYSRVPMAASCNVRLGNDENYPQLEAAQMAGIQEDLKKDICGFQVTRTQDGGIAAMVFSGGKDASYYSAPVQIPVQAQADGFTMMAMAGLPDDESMFDYFHHWAKPAFMTVKVNYADGTSTSTPILYKYHVSNWNSDSSGLESRFVLRGNDKNGKQFGFFAFHVNAQPKQVSSLEFVPACKHGVSLAILDIVAENLKGNLPAGGALPEDLKDARSGDGDENLDCIADFSKGLPAGAIVHFDGSYGEEKPSLRLVPDASSPSKGQVLETVVPPHLPGTGRTRIIVDLPISPEHQFETLVFDYKISEPKAVVHSGIYCGSDAQYSLHDVFFGFGANASKEWGREIVARKNMKAGDGNPSPEKVTYIRFSVWLDNYDKPVTMRLDSCYTGHRYCKWWSASRDLSAK